MSTCKSLQSEKHQVADFQVDFQVANHLKGDPRETKCGTEWTWWPTCKSTRSSRLERKSISIWLTSGKNSRRFLPPTKQKIICGRKANGFNDDNYWLNTKSSLGIFSNEISNFPRTSAEAIYWKCLKMRRQLTTNLFKIISINFKSFKVEKWREIWNASSCWLCGQWATFWFLWFTHGRTKSPRWDLWAMGWHQVARNNLIAFYGYKRMIRRFAWSSRLFIPSVADENGLAVTRRYF